MAPGFQRIGVHEAPAPGQWGCAAVAGGRRNGRTRAWRRCDGAQPEGVAALELRPEAEGLGSGRETGTMDLVSLEGSRGGLGPSTPVT